MRNQPANAPVAEALDPNSWDPKQRTQLSHVQIPAPQILRDNVRCFKLINLCNVLYIFLKNEYNSF